MFNALKYTEELEKVGFTREQSDVSIRAVIDIMNENLATKADLRELEFKLREELKAVEWRLDSRINTLESNLREMEYKLTIKLGSMMALSIGVTATLVRLLPSGIH